MADEVLKHDVNRNTTAAGVTNDANLEIVQMRMDPTTKGVITQEAGSLSPGATATLSNVNDSASSQTLLAANTSRKNAIIVNDSIQFLYLAYAATATSTAFTYLLEPGEVWSMIANTGGIYTGVISGIWVADAAGAARITEIT